MQARATPQMYFSVEVVRKLFHRQTIKTLSGEKERESDIWNFLWLEVVSGSLSWKMGRPAQPQPKRQPSQGRQFLLLNTKRPENRGSRQIFCPTQPVRAKYFRHVSELWTWSILLMHHWRPCLKLRSAILIVLSTVVAKDANHWFQSYSPCARCEKWRCWGAVVAKPLYTNGGRGRRGRLRAQSANLWLSEKSWESSLCCRTFCMCLSHFERCIWISWMLFRGDMGRNTKKWIAIVTPDFLQSGAYHENKTLAQKSEILARWANYQASVFSWLICSCTLARSNVSAVFVG